MSSARIDLYDGAYANYSSEIYRQIRVETYGRDLGQTSWVSQEESSEIPRLLGLQASSSVLEIGCGSGAYAVDLTKNVGCSLVGVDVNAAGVHNANQLADAAGLRVRARFEKCDASQSLPFADESFDAVFSNDVLCHLPGRLQVLREMFRILKRGGRMLFSDALVVGGLISHEEIATRSSIGYYVYGPPGENERLVEHAGFRPVEVRDTTASAARLAQRWRQAREARKNELAVVEGQANFAGLQAFLSCVHTLTSERRLLRYLYVAERRAAEAGSR